MYVLYDHVHVIYEYHIIDEEYVNHQSTIEFHITVHAGAEFVDGTDGIFQYTFTHTLFKFADIPDAHT